MSKSHVAMEQKMCLVTGKLYDTGTILLDRRMEDTLEQPTVTGWGFCPEVQEKLDNGYVAFIGIDPEKSTIKNDRITIKNDRITKEDAYRTGKILYIRRSVLPNIINIPIPEDMQFMFIDDAALEQVAEIQKVIEKTPENPEE